jgi:enterochelin esterase-like enzyme
MCAAAFAQGPATSTNTAVVRAVRAPVYSPEINSDRTVTFRIRAPEAREVTVSGEWGGEALKLTRNDEGVWSGTTQPLQPELYGYAFTIDKVRVADPANPNVKPMRSPTTSMLEIPGDPPLIHEIRDVPHGAVTIHQYYSEDLKAWRRMHVYTPPGYARMDRNYPVLYLFHGSGDNDATWTVLGRANIILDNLIAEKKARPMIVVMTDGHPLAGRITGAPGPEVRQKNLRAFTDDILKEVIPFVEKEYRVIKNAGNRAAAGLSMGGGQSIELGLNNPETFGAVAGFSSFVADSKTAAFKVFESKNKPALIWTACGKDDSLVNNARDLSANLKEHGIKHEFLVTDGNHSWPVWRKYLAQFAPLLFQSAN